MKKARIYQLALYELYRMKEYEVNYLAENPDSQIAKFRIDRHDAEIAELEQLIQEEKK